MWAFNPSSEDLFFAQTIEEVIDTSIIEFPVDSDLSIDMGSVDNNGIIDQGFYYNGQI